MNDRAQADRKPKLPMNLCRVLRKHSVLAAGLVALAASPSQAQFADRLVAYWPFDGDLLDQSDTGAHGTFDPGTGAADLLFAAGQFDQGINLNDFAAGAFDQYVSIDQVGEETFDFAGGSMTISLWASTPFLSIDNQTLIAKGTGNSWALSRDAATSTAVFRGGLSAGAAGAPLEHLIDDTTLHHFVGVVEAGVGVKLYLDGQLIGSVTGNAMISGTDDFLAIGANPAGGDLRAWEGIIDDVAVWSRALTAGEISTLYNNGTGVAVGEALNPADTDGDGMPDFYENTNGLDPNVDDAAADLDGDGLSNLAEFEQGLNPQEADSDGDGLADGAEIDDHDTDPSNPDSDLDGLTDGEEVSGSQNPFLEGTLRDPFEAGVDPAGDPTDPNERDSDGDGFDDLVEIEFKSDPNDSNDAPSPWQIGLKGYWPLDSASYNASGDDSFPDASGRGFPGKLAGTSTNPLWFGSPFYPQVLRLDGSDQRVEIQGDPDEFAMSGQDLTVSAWFLVPAWGKSWQAVVAKGEGNNWRVHRNGENANMAFAGGRGDISGGGAVGDFKWHHVLAQTEHAVGTRLFVDGELVAEGSNATLAANGQAMMIGGNPDTAGDNFRTLFGAITEVAIWNRLLTAAEAKTIFNNFNLATNTGGATIAALIEGKDTDGDGMSDLFEQANGLDPEVDDAGGDLDGDGLNNLEEHDLGTDPNEPDTDGDGLTDGDEVDGTSNPYLDGNFRENFEVGVDPAGDPTDPVRIDSDGDSFEDGEEIDGGFDPNSVSSRPPAPEARWDAASLGNGPVTQWTSSGSEQITARVPAQGGTPFMNGEGVVLDGDDGFQISPADNFLLETPAWTATVVFKADGDQGEGGATRPNGPAPNDANHWWSNAALVGLELPGNPNPTDWGLFLNSEHEAVIGNGHGGAPQGVIHDGVALNDGEQHIITGVFDAENDFYRLYIDGEQIADRANAGVFPPGDGINFGCNIFNVPGDRAYFRGELRTIILRQEAMPDQEVLDLHNVLANATTEDGDGDGLPDLFEDSNGLDKTDPSDADEDPDGDGLTNLEEFEARTNPNSVDSDGDGLEDGVEDPSLPFVDINQPGTDPADRDSDDDGFDDGIEIQFGTDPTDGNDFPPVAFARFDADSLEDGAVTEWISTGTQVVTARVPGADGGDPTKDSQGLCLDGNDGLQISAGDNFLLGMPVWSATVVFSADGAQGEGGATRPNGDGNDPNGWWSNAVLVGLELPGNPNPTDWGIFLNAEHEAVFGNGAGPGPQGAIHQDVALNDGVPHVLTAVYDTGSDIRRLYLDGALILEQAGGVFPPGQGINIGCNIFTAPGDRAYYNGKLHTIILQDTALDGAEIEDLHNTLLSEVGGGGPTATLANVALNVAGDMGTLTFTGLEVGQTYHVVASDDGEDFIPVPGSQFVAAAEEESIDLPVDTVTNPTVIVKGQLGPLP